MPGANEEMSSVDLAVGDVTPPVDGAMLWAEDVLANSLTLLFDEATDDRGVTGYNVYQDGVMIGSGQHVRWADALGGHCNGLHR